MRRRRLRESENLSHGQMEETHGRLHGQRSAKRGWRRGQHTAVVGAARASQIDGHQIRLRHRVLRRLHGAYRRAGDPRLRHADIMVEGKSVTTIEGLSPDGSHPLQKAWIAEQVPQCGYCQSGQIMQAAELLARNKAPSREEIVEHMDGNICRCGTYLKIISAIQRASREG